MPSAIPLPTTRELLDAYKGATQGERDETIDLHSGSGYDVHAGVGAMLWLREATRDRDIFRAVYVDTAEGDELDRIILKRTGVARIQETHGAGVAELRRASAGGGAGTFWRGTRISLLSGGLALPKVYPVAADMPCGATALGATVPVQAFDGGAGHTADTIATPPLVIRIEDELWDDSWQVTRLACGEGTDRESPTAYRERARQGRRDARPGYIKSITDACVKAGASHVALFPSDFLATGPLGSPTGDYGISRCFVGDSGYSATQALINRCIVALESVRVCGADLPVFGMAPAAVGLTIGIRLWNDPGRFDVQAIKRAALAGATNYFGSRSNAFYFRASAIGGAIRALVRDTQDIEVTPSPAEPVLATLFATAPLPRYYLNPSQVSITVSGPA